MIEDLKKALAAFDSDNQQYVVDNEETIRRCLATGEPFPQGITSYLANVYEQRKVMVEAINKLSAIDPIGE